jgi:hypothetical protein
MPSRSGPAKASRSRYLALAALATPLLAALGACSTAPSASRPLVTVRTISDTARLAVRGDRLLFELPIQIRNARPETVYVDGCEPWLLRAADYAWSAWLDAERCESGGVQAIPPGGALIDTARVVIVAGPRLAEVRPLFRKPERYRLMYILGRGYPGSAATARPHDVGPLLDGAERDSNVFLLLPDTGLASRPATERSLQLTGARSIMVENAGAKLTTDS